MVVVMAPGATEAEISTVTAHIEAHGGKAFVSRGVTRTIIGVIGTEDVLETLDVSGLSGVTETMRITLDHGTTAAV